MNYKHLINNAVIKLQYREILVSDGNKMLYYQEDHFFAISYLCDISIFINNSEIIVWFVYNEFWKQRIHIYFV